MDELSQRYFGIIKKMIKENKTTKELEKELKKTKSKKMDLSNILGELLAKRAKEKKNKQCLF